MRFIPHGSWVNRVRSLAPFFLSLMAGVVSVAGFAPFGAFWVLPFSLAALYRLADGAPQPRAALFGLAYGIGEFTAGIYWLWIALTGVDGVPLPLALVLLGGLIVLLSGFIAVVMAIAARLAATPGALRYLLWLPALWTLIEWVRSWFFTGFPWLSIGYSQIDSPLAGLAPILGVFGVSWAVALSAGLIAWASHRPRIVPLAIAGLITLWVSTYGLGRIQWTHATGSTMSIVLVQGNIAQQAKWSEKAVHSAIKRYSNLTHGHWHANLIVWPETAIPDYYSDVKGPLNQLGTDLAKHPTTLITGLLSANGAKHKVYNSAIAIGAGHGLYRKRHLVPFGEYFPVPAFVRHWMAKLGLPFRNLSAGPRHQKPITANGVPLGMSICYEDAFGPLIASDVPPARILVNISDDNWFGHSIGPQQHFQMARMRAAATGRYLVRADNSAVTGIIAPDGHVVARAPGFEPTAITGTVRPYAGLTPFDRWGNWCVATLLGLLITGAGLVRLTMIRRRLRDARHHSEAM